ncbi:arylsulfatase [Halalkalibaculum sp. DA3122]|uniref:arylsulfatase n=1 Tax=Halalkalibaculum sp. DA3122 TaxID=3373607 RepID=UPI0037548704
MQKTITSGAERPSTFSWTVPLILLFVFVSCTGDSEGDGELDTRKPNIVFIMADDLGYGDLGSYGQQQIKTPYLDQLAAEGMRFTQHYSGSTVCAPSRSVLMTGLHTGHTPIRGNREHNPIGQFPIPDSAVTVAELLQKAGYKTGAFGKWGLGYPGSEGSPGKQGFDYFYGYNGQRRAHFFYPEFLFREEAGKEPVRVPLKGNEVRDTSRPGFEHPGSGPPVKRGTYSQDAIMEEALSFVERQAVEDQPFFAYLPLNIPHASLTLPESALEPYLDEEGNSIFKEEPFEGGHYAAQPMPRATYAAMITLLDDYVGRLIRKLREQDIAEQTLVIFTSDNGPHSEGGHDPAFFDSNGPLRGIKRDLYEGGIRVPMIAWWPGQIQEGATSDHISAFEDFMPTFAELAGTQPPSRTDGVSMVPTLLDQPGQKERAYLYWEFPARGGKQAVRMGKWKAVRLNVSRDPESPIELYNLERDLSEKHNVAEQHPEVIEEIKQIFEEARTPSEYFTLF